MPLLQTTPHTHGAAATAPDASRAERLRSFDPEAFGIPTGREEEWRFTPVDRLGALFANEATGACLDWQQSLPSGVTVTTESVATWRAGGAPAPADRAAAVAAAHSGGVAVIDVPAGAQVAEPVRVTVSGRAGETVHGHLQVRVGAGAKATVVLRHAGRAAYSEVLTVTAGDQAQLTLVTIQDWEQTSIHLGQHDVVVGRDATVRHIAVSLGGSIVRLSTNATYAGPGGRFEGLGVYFADAGQHLEHRLFVDHEAPHCASDVLYKGALQGDSAHSVWIGDVLIRASAQGTDTYELNRNLLLTEGARADSVPNLEIETGQIEGAGHACATGRFDDEQLFYLMARGIPLSEATRLVVRGFFADVVGRIGIEAVHNELMAAIEAELGHSDGDRLDAADGAQR
jgi:Fe-S cluster assembly protein SufD